MNTTTKRTRTKMTTDEMLASVLRRFISKNRDDHGYAALDEDNTLVLDGNVQLTNEEYGVIYPLLRS